MYYLDESKSSKGRIPLPCGLKHLFVSNSRVTLSTGDVFVVILSRSPEGQMASQHVNALDQNIADCTHTHNVVVLSVHFLPPSAPLKDKKHVRSDPKY